jgi:hypothetical protein
LSEAQSDNSDETHRLSVSKMKGHKLYFGYKLTAAEDSIEDQSEEDTEKSEASPDDRPSDLVLLANGWVRTSIGLFDALPAVLASTRATSSHYFDEKIVSYLEANFTSKDVVDVDDRIEEVVYVIGDGVLDNLRPKLTRARHVFHTSDSIRRTSLIALLAEYETFFKELLRILISMEPNSFFDKNASVPVAKLFTSKSISDLQDEYFQERVEALAWDSSINQLKFVRESFKIPISLNDNLLLDFQEVCIRRNCLAHSVNSVDETYLEKCHDAGIAKNRLPKLGNRLDVSPTYLKSAIGTVFLVGLFTVQLLIQKIKPEEAESALNFCINASHDLLELKQYDAAKQVCDFGLNSKSPASEIQKAMLTINLALASHLNDELEDDERQKCVEGVLGRRDWSLITPQFSLALACLREDYMKIEALLDAARNDDVSEREILEWALFRRARQVEDFRIAVSKIFGMEIATEEE